LAFQTACTELSGALLEETARPCLLQTGSGREPSVQIWNGTELVTIANELLHSPHCLQPSAHAPAAAATSTATSGMPEIVGLFYLYTRSLLTLMHTFSCNFNCNSTSPVACCCCCGCARASGAKAYIYNQEEAQEGHIRLSGGG